MTTNSAQSAVVLSAGVTFASTSIEKISKGEIPSGRMIAGTCLTFAALGILANVGPDLAGGLAICIAGTAFVTFGLPSIQKVYGK